MKTKITREEYDRILATELSSDVAPGTPGHIDDHELIAQKIAYSGSLSVGGFYKARDDQWTHSYMDETAGISETGPHTTDETLIMIDDFSSGSEYFLVFPTEESISDPSGVPDQSRIDIRVFNSKSFDELFTFLHHYVSHSLRDEISLLVQMPGFVDSLYNQVEGLDTKVSTLESDNSSLSTTVSTLESDNATLNTTVSQLGEDITTLSNANSTLEGQVSTLESDNASLNATVSGLEADFGSLSSANGTLNSTVSTLEGNVTTLTSDKEALEGQVSTLESTIADLTTRLEALEASDPE